MNLETDPEIDLFIYDISKLQGKYVRVKPASKNTNTQVLGIEFGAGIFDSRLLKEILEKINKKSQTIKLNDFSNNSQDAVEENSIEYPAFTYWKHKTEEGVEYSIRSTDLLPPINFPLREFVYY